MIVKGCRGAFGYEVINQSLLSDEVMEILNLSERQYAASLEMELLACTRQLRETTYSRLIHSGWDILSFALVSSLLSIGSKPQAARETGAAILDVFATALDLGLDDDQIDLSAIISEQVECFAQSEHSQVHEQRSQCFTEVLTAALVSALDMLTSFLSFADAAPSDLCGRQRRHEALYG